jgi:enoyl-CoA hydratase/carnithine racemase
MLVDLEVEGALATIFLQRLDKRNAINLDVLRAIEAACDKIESDMSVRVAILTGRERSFSAGGDIRAWAAMDPGTFGHLWVRHGHRVFDRLAALRVPLIAAINGHALGGGLELAAAADFRIADASIQVGMPEAGLGMVPGWSGTQRLVRRFGAQPVRRMVLGGEVFDAEAARALGLVDQVVPDGTALEAARAAAMRIAERAPRASELIKLMLSVGADEDRGAAVEALASIAAAGTPDLAEGVAAFREKRSAKFKGDWS